MHAHDTTKKYLEKKCIDFSLLLCLVFKTLLYLLAIKVYVGERDRERERDRNKRGK